MIAPDDGLNLILPFVCRHRVEPDGLVHRLRRSALTQAVFGSRSAASGQLQAQVAVRPYQTFDYPSAVLPNGQATLIGKQRIFQPIA